MSGTHFCQYCLSTQPIYAYEEAGRRKLRCETCGLPLDVEKLGAGGRDLVPSTSARPKVLCVDDDQLLLSLFAKALEDQDLQPFTATTGAAGIELARQERPDVILLDVMMPGMSGFEVCRRLRSGPEFKDTPIIILTAMHDPRLNVKGFEAGATLAMRKPFDPEKLILTIKTALTLKAKGAGT